MTQLAQDLFDRADGGLGANWSNATTVAIASQAIHAASGSELFPYYNAVTWPADLYSEIVVGTLDTVTDNGAGPAIVNGTNLYLVQTNTSETRCYKRISGGYTQLGSDGAACAVNDVLRLIRNGTSISVTRNGSTIIGPVTDSAVSGGYAGVWFSGPGGYANSWAGGNLSTAAAVVPQIAAFQRMIRDA